MSEEAGLESWRDTATRRVIVDFVERVTGSGPESIPAEQRIAVFDNDGTLWTEKPMPTQLHFIVLQWAAAVRADPSLADTQPYKAAASQDFGWLGAATRQALRRRRLRPHDDHRRAAEPDRGHVGRGLRTGGLRVLSGRPAPDPRAPVRFRGLPADDRVAPLPRGERVHVLHRLRR